MKRLHALCLFATVVVAGVVLPCIATAQPPGGGRGPGGRGPGGGSPLEMMSQLFDLADANGDGQLTKSELTAAMNNQRGGNQQRRGGPPAGQARGQGRGQDAGQNQMQAGPGGREGGPPPRPGQILPDFVTQSLNMTDKQQKQLAALQTQVDKRLAAMLTDEQKQLLQNLQQPGPRGQGGADREAGGRPQRPQ